MPTSALDTLLAFLFTSSFPSFPAQLKLNDRIFAILGEKREGGRGGGGAYWSQQKGTAYLRIFGGKKVT